MKGLWLLFALFAGLSTGCHRGGTPAESKVHSESAITVSVCSVTLEETARPHELVGSIRAKDRAVLEAKVSGRIERMLATPGKGVQQGEPLVEIDVREYHARVDYARALHQRAQTDRTRLEALWRKEAATKAELDTAAAQESAAAASLREAEIMAGQGRIAAPFDGVVTRKFAEAGDLATLGKAVVEIEDPKRLRFQAEVPESLIDRIQIESVQKIQIASGPVLSAPVVEISPAGDPASRTFRVELELPREAAGRSGMHGRLLLAGEKTQSLFLPASAVLPRGQLETVFVAAQGRAQLRLVRTGPSRDGLMEILAGLNAGETIIVSNVAGLRDGQPIRLAEPVR